MTSIKDGINGFTLANQIRLERATHKGSFLLVEGDTDAKLFAKFCDIDVCSLVVCLGKENLYEAIDDLEISGFQGVLGLADRDFANFVGYRDCNGTVIYTDENDIELMMLSSKSLKKVLEEFGDERAISRSTKAEGKTVRDIIFASASMVGSLRLVSQLNSLSLRFDGMAYKFTDSNSCLLDKEKTVKHVLGRSAQRRECNEHRVMEMVGVLMSQEKSPMELCQGHDCVRVLGRGLKKQFGKTNSFNNNAGSKMLEGILRLSYEFGDFSGSRSYENIRQWERETGFRVLIKK